MSDTTPPARHQAIFCHYDSYSAALLFVRWPDGSLLWPAPAAPQQACGDGDALHDALCVSLGVDGETVLLERDFDETLQVDGDTVQVHLLRSTLPDAPHAVAESAGASFRHLPALRGSAPAELALLRVVFNLYVGGAGRR